jgi:hypothetical protein
MDKYKVKIEPDALVDEVLAVISTDRNPKICQEKTNKY